MESLYILKLENGNYYVGKSTNVSARYRQHRDGIGSAWTSKHRPVKIVEVRKLKDEYDENNTTKDYMKKYGIDKVRGGAYCQIELSDITKSHLEHELNADTNKCYICGESGHFARECDQVWICDFCPKEFTSEHKCLEHEEICQGQMGCCYRCGRNSHHSTECFAKMHIKGYYL